MAKTCTPSWERCVPGRIVRTAGIRKLNDALGVPSRPARSGSGLVVEDVSGKLVVVLGGTMFAARHGVHAVHLKPSLLPFDADAVVL
jgi:hypothetical protein